MLAFGDVPTKHGIPLPRKEHRNQLQRPQWKSCIDASSLSCFVGLGVQELEKPCGLSFAFSCVVKESKSCCSFCDAQEKRNAFRDHLWREVQLWLVLIGFDWLMCVICDVVTVLCDVLRRRCQLSIVKFTNDSNSEFFLFGHLYLIFMSRYIKTKYMSQ